MSRNAIFEFAGLRLRDHALDALYRIKIVAELEHERIHRQAGRGEQAVDPLDGDRFPRGPGFQVRPRVWTRLYRGRRGALVAVLFDALSHRRIDVAVGRGLNAFLHRPAADDFIVPGAAAEAPLVPSLKYEGNFLAMNAFVPPNHIAPGHR
jgi:hypothetical protein